MKIEGPRQVNSTHFFIQEINQYVRSNPGEADFNKVKSYVKTKLESQGQRFSSKDFELAWRQAGFKGKRI